MGSRVAWKRSGTLLLAGHTEIDLHRAKAWITIKADDKTCERLAVDLLRFLNRKPKPQRSPRLARGKAGSRG